MKGLDLKGVRSYSPERGGTETKNDGKNRLLYSYINIKYVMQYPFVYIWFPFLRLPPNFKKGTKVNKYHLEEAIFLSFPPHF